MPLEYEALIGHLYVVGGRSISVAPPGLLVEVAPKKAARGRETDTFFALVTPAGETVAPAAFYERMAGLASDEYFESSGSVTSALRDVLSNINENLFEHNSSDPRHYEANMICGVLRGADLYLGKIGAGAALLVHRDTMQAFPAAFSEKAALSGTALGVDMTPDIKMAHYTVSSGSRLLLADGTLTDHTEDELAAAARLDDIGAVLTRLRELAKTQITALALEFVAPEQPTPLPVKVVESTTEAQPVVTSPVGDTPPTDASKVGTIRRSEARGAGVRKIMGKAAAGGATASERAAEVFERLVPAPKETGKGWLSSPLAAGVTVLIPVIVVVLVVIFWISGTGASEFDQCVERTNNLAITARGIASSDVTGTLAAWNGVLALANECASMKDEADPLLSITQTEARTIIDRLLNIERRSVTVVEAFTNADLTQIVIQGEDVYVLDSRNQQVYRLTLASGGMSLVPGTRTPIQAMRRSGSVLQYTVGNLIDVAWAEDGRGVAQGNVITALDENGLLIACPPRFLQDCTAQQLQGTETWEAPRAIAYWEGRLYILDPGANQIWRYDPSGGAFPGMPLEYFTGERRPDIRRALDFAITNAGDIYLLLEAGVVVRFTSGTLQPFAFSGFPEGQSTEESSAFFLNTNPIAQGLYFVNRTTRTVYETTMAGTFINSYRASDEQFFAQLSNVYADTDQQVVYVLSGNSLLAFQRSQ
ncbi:MAG: hypothetical protein IAE80_25810 [Anaerolinea sp.]|nr:hypothetical protein [Anaerolinea sp.]